MEFNFVSFQQLSPATKLVELDLLEIFVAILDILTWRVLAKKRLDLFQSCYSAAGEENYLIATDGAQSI